MRPLVHGRPTSPSCTTGRRAGRGRPALLRRLARRPRPAAHRRPGQRPCRRPSPPRPGAASTSAGCSGARTGPARLPAPRSRLLGEEIDEAGGQCLLDMRVRTGGSHHQKFVVLRHRDDPTRDVAFVGGIDLCHSRRDDAAHQGDAAGDRRWPPAYGPRPAWHDVQRRRAGPGGGRRGDHLPRALGGPARRSTLNPGPAAVEPGCSASRRPRAARRAVPAARRRGGAARRPGAAHLPRRPAQGLRLRPGRRAQRGPRQHQGGRAGPAGWSTSRTSTCGPSEVGRPLRRGAARATPSCGWSP